MKYYVLYNKEGEIVSTGTCMDGDLSIQTRAGTFILEGKADDRYQKIADGQVVDKTPEEIAADSPSKSEPLPFEKQSAFITNEQYQNILSRLNNLEGKI